MESLQKDLREAVRLAQTNATEAQRKQAKEYNRKVKGTSLEIGDHVLLSNRKERTRGKLADLWDSTVHMITWKDPSLHIYRVEDPLTKKSRVVHRNFLLPVNFLPLEEPDEDSTVPSTLSVEEDPERMGDRNRTFCNTDLESRSCRTADWVLCGQNACSPQCVSEREAEELCTEEDAEPGVTTLEHHMGTSECLERQNTSCGSDTEDHEDGLPRGEMSDQTEVIKTETRHGEELLLSSLSSFSSSESSVAPSETDGCSDQMDRSCRSQTTHRTLRKRERRIFPGVEDLLANTPSEGTVRTRSGRLVKPVKRLLECTSMMISETEQLDLLSDLFKVLSALVGC